MSHNPQNPEQEEDDAHLSEEDIVEVHEDEGDEPMDDDDDDDDDNNDKYDGEIVIGGPATSEEEAMWEAEQAREDNSWGVSSWSILRCPQSVRVSRVKADREQLYMHHHNPSLQSHSILNSQIHH